MSKYQKYVWDFEKKKIKGEFEKMYLNEKKENYDSWYQEDHRALERKVNLMLVERYNFGFILDLGCGKGSLTHLLKKENNRVLGIDISKTVIKAAKAKYPDLDFDHLNMGNIKKLVHLLDSFGSNPPDLIVATNVLFFLKNWQEIIRLISMYTTYFLISMHIPDNSMGYIKSGDELISTLKKNFYLLEIVNLRKSNMISVFGKSKNA